MAVITKEAKAKYYPLGPGESWWMCEGCKHRILGKILPDGRLQIRIRGYVYTIEPDHRVVIMTPCLCEDPPHQNILVLTKGQ